MFTHQEIVETLKSVTVEELEKSKSVVEPLDNFLSGNSRLYITEEEIDALEELWKDYSDEILIATIVRKLLKEMVCETN